MTTSRRNNGHHRHERAAASPEICLEDYYAQAIVIGTLRTMALSSGVPELPPREWLTNLALDYGTFIARESRRRRKRR